jgi:5'(3')-deoxyribonucleotidase
MARIGISINEVLRDTLSQLDYTYSKYISEKETTVTRDEITSFDLTKHFEFESTKQLNRFLFDEASLEIFGHADQMFENLMTKFNMFLVDIDEEEEHTIELVSREYLKSIPSTLFFLSKLGCRATNIRFIKQNEDEWDGLDILITANPVALENKPDNKISVKVKAPYNSNSVADYELNSILEFIMDGFIREKIINTKITNQLID